MTARHSDSSIWMGGLALLAAALGFIGAFTYLAVRFDYPGVLEAPAMTALPALLAMGSTGRAVWALYGLLPLLLIPAAVGARTAFRGSNEDGMHMAVLLAVVAAVSMMLGLQRWPSIQWELARAYASSGPEARTVIAAVFDGLNRYLGNYLGEFVGELSLNAFFLLSARAMWRSRSVPRWIAGLGVISGALGSIAMWRNVTDLVAPVAALNNAALPLWMIVFGVTLLAIGAHLQGHPQMAAKPLLRFAEDSPDELCPLCRTMPNAIATMPLPNRVVGVCRRTLIAERYAFRG